MGTNSDRYAENVNAGRNVYSPDDELGAGLPVGPRIFISHRSADKPIARAVAGVLSSLGVHYWLDEQDHDLQRAAALGLVGQQGVVHAIERGVAHSSALLGVVSARTVGSWWVPYEIGFSRAAGKASNFVLTGDRRDIRLPSFARIAATYTSVDELARWASTLTGHDLHSDLTGIPEVSIRQLAQYLPLDPPEPDVVSLCERALDAIEILANPAAQQTLALTSEEFDWMPTTGALAAEIGYDLFAPLALLPVPVSVEPEVRAMLETAYRIPVRHYQIAAEGPALDYAPACAGWKIVRYQTPARNWLQGLDLSQLADRLDLFLTTRDRQGGLRMATRDEFKAEFYRVLSSVDERSRRGLGVLLNPLFGFTPQSRPVFWRILALHWVLYESITGPRKSAPFDEDLRRLAHDYLDRQT